MHVINAPIKVFPTSIWEKEGFNHGITLKLHPQGRGICIVLYIAIITPQLELLKPWVLGCGERRGLDKKIYWTLGDRDYSAGQIPSYSPIAGMGGGGAKL